VVTQANGLGKSIYLPWFPGTQFYRHGQLNTLYFISDVIEQAAGLQSLGEKLPAQVEVTLFENDRGAILVHLVNASGHFGNSYHAPIRMTNLAIEIPWKTNPPQSAVALCGDHPVAFKLIGSKLSLLIPELELFEAIRLE
jgi:hypothetical protein